MYSIEEFDKEKSKVLKYVLYKKRSKQEVKNKFYNTIDSQMLNDIIEELEENQIALSSRINDNVGRLFSQFIEEDKQGKFDTDRKKATLAELHKSSVSPDDLNADNADAYVDILSVTDINTFIAEKELSEAKNKKDHQENLKKMEEMNLEITSEFWLWLQH